MRMNHRLHMEALEPNNGLCTAANPTPAQARPPAGAGNEHWATVRIDPVLKRACRLLELEPFLRIAIARAGSAAEPAPAGVG